MTPTSLPNPDVFRQLILECLPPGTPEDALLFGEGGLLDSLGLVTLLADLEYKIQASSGREVVLASEAALSRSRSPFRSVATLSEYCVELLSS